MEKHLYSLLAIFPTPNIEETAKYYNEVLGFRIVRYLDVKEPHICLYRDSTEIVLTQANSKKVFPNRELYGYGEDAYFLLLIIRKRCWMSLKETALKLFVRSIKQIIIIGNLC